MPCYDWLCHDLVIDVPASSGCTDWEMGKGQGVCRLVCDLLSDWSNISTMESVSVEREGCGLIADGYTRNNSTTRGSAVTVRRSVERFWLLVVLIEGGDLCRPDIGQPT